MARSLSCRRAHHVAVCEHHALVVGSVEEELRGRRRGVKFDTLALAGLLLHSRFRFRSTTNPTSFTFTFTLHLHHSIDPSLSRIHCVASNSKLRKGHAVSCSRFFSWRQRASVRLITRLWEKGIGQVVWLAGIWSPFTRRMALIRRRSL